MTTIQTPNGLILDTEGMVKQFACNTAAMIWCKVEGITSFDLITDSFKANVSL